MAYQSDHRERALAIACDAYGQVGWTVTSGHFHRCPSDRTLETLEVDAIERAVEVRKVGRKGVGHNNPNDGRGLYYEPMVVRVGYALTAAGDSYDAAGEQSGAGTLAAVEDRAAMDADTLEARVGYQPNWSGLDPHVIDCEPDPEGRGDGWLTVLPDRVIAEILFRLTTKATLPGSRGPSLA